ncbi:MAG: DUF1292 domain-containing protein [Clostridiales bacterium]|nr:DUF1292 domain-containing protein [Clostridiales bacterium]
MEENENIITLLDDDGKEIQCEVIDMFEFNEKEYAVLLPEEEDDPYILRVDKDEDGNEVFAVIDSDDEFEKVADAYDELLEDDEE